MSWTTLKQEMCSTKTFYQGGTSGYTKPFSDSFIKFEGLAIPQFSKGDDEPWQVAMSECPNDDFLHDTLSDCSENILESHFQIRYQAV
jgi:hypothetical protein